MCLRDQKGFTLAETLIAIAILAIVTVGGATASSAVLTARNRMIETANAEVLGSTAAEALADELRFGRSIKAAAAGSNAITLDSALFGDDTTLQLVDGFLTAAVEDTAGSGSVSHDLLSRKSYDGLTFGNDGLAFTADPATGHVRVELKVYSGTNVLWEGEFTVAPLNGVQADP